MKPRSLALATFVALFGATASFGAVASGEKPIDETGPVTGQTLDPADPATTPAELYETDKSLAAETADDEAADDDDDSDDADDDDAMDDASDDAAAEAAASDPTLTQTTAATTIAPATGAQKPRAPSDVARMDSDGNGTLEVGEVPDKSALNARFADYDIDKDGSLSVNEFQSWLGPDFVMTGVAVEQTDADDPTLPSEEVTDADALTAQTAEEAEDTESEDLGGEKDRPSDAGTPDVDSDEEEATDDDDNDD